jgi:hypothetical protein
MSAEKKSANPVEVANPTETVKAEEPAPAAAPAAPVAPAATPAAKKPMDPKKKKNIIIWSCVGGGVLIAGIVAIVLVIILTKVDYEESYKIALQLDNKISTFYYNYDDCSDVVDDVNDTWSSTSSYSSRISDCKKAISKETIELVNKLAGTSGVARDSEVKAKFDAFNVEYQKAISSVNDDTEKTLDTYDSWHKFVYESDSIGFYSSTTEEKINTIANYAINSGNDTFKAFGEQWKTKALEVYQARKAYDDATTNYSDLYKTFSTKRDALETWLENNLPKPSEVLPLSFDGNEYTVNDAWNEFTSILGTKYGEKAIEDVINGSSYEDIWNELMK